MFGAIEAGGTKFVCAVGDEAFEIIDQVTIPTTVPEETMPKVIAFFEPYAEKLQAIGISSFGPIDVTRESETYGYITNTPKIKWQFLDFLGTVKEAFPGIPMTWTTDVNGSAYGEYTVREGVEHLVYYTIGTGIGGGAISNGQIIEGVTHPEMGHVPIRKHPDDEFAGICPNHGDCFEGSACGPAIEARIGKNSKEIPTDDPYWDIQAYYIAQSAFNTSLFYSPEVIIYGGGVMKVPGLLDKVREQFAQINQEYIDVPPLDEYIVTPALEDTAAIVGSFAMAKAEVDA